MIVTFLYYCKFDKHKMHKLDENTRDGKQSGYWGERPVRENWDGCQGLRVLDLEIQYIYIMAKLYITKTLRVICKYKRGRGSPMTGKALPTSATFKKMEIG